MQRDVVVVGAGPAGSTAAREIAASGARVLLLDRAEFPRDKPCGGAVSLRAAALLPFDIAPVVERTVTGMIFDEPSVGRVTCDIHAPVAYLTQRRRLDAFLVDRAQETGVEFQPGQTVRGIQQQPDGTLRIEIDSRHGSAVLSARTVIGADGANGAVARAMRLDPAAEHGVALEGNLTGPVPPWLEHRVLVTPGLLPGGYGWLFPKGDHINVGVGGWKGPAGPRLQETLAIYTRRFGWEPGMLEHVRGHHLPMQRPGATITAGAVALVGDAAGLLDPLTGEGIYAAIASGVAVARPVIEYLAGTVSDLSGYEREIAQRLVPELKLSRALMEIFYAWPRPITNVLLHSARTVRIGTTLIATASSERGPIAPLSLAATSLITPLARLARFVLQRRYPTR